MRKLTATIEKRSSYYVKGLIIQAYGFISGC